MSWSSCRAEDVLKPGNRFIGPDGQPRFGQLRITLDGVDISNECVYAHEESGVVVVNLRNADGELYTVAGGTIIAREARFGLVEIIEVNS